MNIEEFRQQNLQPIKSYPLALQALWYDYQGDWHKSSWKKVVSLALYTPVKEYLMITLLTPRENLLKVGQPTPSHFQLYLSDSNW